MDCKLDSPEYAAFEVSDNLIPSADRSRDQSQTHTGEHCQTIYIIKFSVTFTFETSPDVGYQYLCSLIESDGLALEFGFVTKAREMTFEEVCKGSGGAIRLFDAVEERPTEILRGRKQSEIQTDKDIRELLFPHLLKNLASFSKTAYPFIQKRYLFVCRRAENVLYLLICALFADPICWICDGDTYATIVKVHS